MLHKADEYRMHGAELQPCLRYALTPLSFRRGHIDEQFVRRLCPYKTLCVGLADVRYYISGYLYVFLPNLSEHVYSSRDLYVLNTLRHAAIELACLELKNPHSVCVIHLQTIKHTSRQ